MTNIDQFESVFKSATRNLFEFQRLQFQRCIVVTNQDEAANERYAAQIQALLRTATNDEPATWQTISGEVLDSVDDFLSEVRNLEPDLICTYRNLTIPVSGHTYSLGTHLDVLTQATEIPVFVSPNPRTNEMRDKLNTVMAITDHLDGEHDLVNAAIAVTPDGGNLWLTHVEDQVIFDRYIDTIAKIPDIDTDMARTLILEQLLKDPSDYIESCEKVLTEARSQIHIHKLVTLGHHLKDYKQLITDHAVDLLVINAKDEDQLAMHGLAYPLSVELREVPLLLL